MEKHSKLDLHSISRRLCIEYLAELRNIKTTKNQTPLAGFIEDVLPASTIDHLRLGSGEPNDELISIVVKLLRDNSTVRRQVLNFGRKSGSAGSNPRLFVSYRRSCSGDFVVYFVEKLIHECGFDVVYDRNSLRTGSFPSQLGALIRSCEILLLIVEQNTLEHIGDKSNFIRRELVTALHHKIPIVPILVDTENALDTVDWPSDIFQVSEQQAIFFKRMLFDESVKSLQNGVDNLLNR